MLLGKVTTVHPPQVKHGNETVKVIVGPQQEEFTVHKTLLCAASEFFKAALSSNFIEGKEQKVTLPEDDPQYFQLVYDWLYSGRVADGVSSYLKKEDICAGDIFWWKLFQIGDRLMIDRLCVLAIDKIQKLFSSKKLLVPSKVFIEELFEDGKLPGLETYMTEHVVYWLQRSKDPSVWDAMPDAHPKFGQALAKGAIAALKFNTVHPRKHTSVLKVDGYLSPWKIAGVAGAPTKNTGGGTELREKHLSEIISACITNLHKTDKNAGRAEVVESKVNNPVDAKKEQERVGEPSETLKVPGTDAPITEPEKLRTTDGRLLVPLYFPKDGILNKSDLKFLLRKAYEAAELDDMGETADLERLLFMLGLIRLSETIPDLNDQLWFDADVPDFSYRLSCKAQWDRIDCYYWTDQDKKTIALGGGDGGKNTNSGHGGRSDMISFGGLFD